MKHTYLQLLTLLIVLLTGTAANAQTGKPSLSLGPEAALPFNTEHNYIKTRDVYQTGVGASLKLELPITQKLAFTVTAGYLYYHSNLHYYYETTGFIPALYIMGGESSPPPYQFIPVKAGLRYYYCKHLYIDADAGDALKVGTGAKSSFIYSGGVGGIIPISAHHGLDLGARYESGYKNQDYPYAMKQIAIRLAYRLGF